MISFCNAPFSTWLFGRLSESLKFAAVVASSQKELRLQKFGKLVQLLVNNLRLTTLLLINVVGIPCN